MAAIVFDPLEYSRLLEGAGVPRDQAEVHARAMTTAFLHNVDALVTKDYLDSRFCEFETRIEANINRRFAEVDNRFAEVDVRLARIDGQFGKVYVMLGVIMVGVAIPALQSFLG